MNARNTYQWGWIGVIALMMTILSCTKDEAVDAFFIDASLQEYFDRFVVEADARGRAIDYEQLRIRGYIRLINAPNVVGQCAHNEDRPNEVIIDKRYFDSANDLEREFLVFHELGHCALNRDHLDDEDHNGFCVSIMTSGSGLCQIRYSASTRKALIDELFNR